MNVQKSERGCASQQRLQHGLCPLVLAQLHRVQISGANRGCKGQDLIASLSLGNIRWLEEMRCKFSLLGGIQGIYHCSISSMPTLYYSPMLPFVSFRLPLPAVPSLPHIANPVFGEGTSFSLSYVSPFYSTVGLYYTKLSKNVFFIPSHGHQSGYWYQWEKMPQGFIATL